MPAFIHRLSIVAVFCGLTAALPRVCYAAAVTFGMGADDYGSLTISASNVCTYDNISAAGGCNGVVNMTPGVWYDINIDYKNRFGSDGMALKWNQPGTPACCGGGYGSVADFLAPNLVPLANLRTLNGAAYVSGLTGSYFELDGAFVKTVIGEGPINNINNIYDNAFSPDNWAGFGYFSLFEERLVGQIMLSASAVPEPASAMTILAGLAGLALARRRRRGRSLNAAGA